jgi:transposase
MTTNKTRREFADEFKREAVVLLRDSGRPLTQIAAELGLEPPVLRPWRSLVNGTAAGVMAVRPASAVTASPEQTEIRHLRRELERVQMERDILKNERVRAARLWR